MLHHIPVSALVSREGEGTQQQSDDTFLITMLITRQSLGHEAMLGVGLVAVSHQAVRTLIASTKV